jgi:Uma2 family endonuclease
MGTPTRLITYEDSLTMPENRFEEILHGESRIMPPATKKHGTLIRKLAQAFRSRLHPSEFEVVVEGVGIGIERVPLTYRVPDLMVFRSELLSQDEDSEKDPYIWIVPELIVECLSPSNRKGSIRELLADYAQIAVPEVWLLDPAEPRFTSYRYQSGALHERQTLERGAVSPLAFSSLTVDLNELWAVFEGRRK